MIASVFWVQAQDSLQNKSSFAIFPAFSYAPETSAQLGAVAIWVLKNKNPQDTTFKRESTLTPYFLYTLKNQIISAINLDYYTSGGNNLNGTLRVFDFPDFYFGIGNANDPDISESYTNRFVQLEGQYLKRMNDNMFVGGGIDMHFTSIRDILPNGIMALSQPNGIDGGNIVGAGPAFRYDSRDYTIYPTKGYLITSAVVLNYLGDFQFTTVSADFRKYLRLVNEKNVLAFQFRSEWTIGTDVPFYKLPRLAGDSRLRGISNASLYRDRQMMYAQVEYRRPLFWRFGMTVFAGIGDVAYDINDFTPSEFKYIAGIGGRFAAIPEKKLNIRLDIGVGRGGQSGIYIGLSEAF